MLFAIFSRFTTLLVLVTAGFVEFAECSEKPLSQVLVEQNLGVICDNASAKEIGKLKCATGSQYRNVGNLDETSESIVFRTIGQQELTRIQCRERNISQLLSDSNLKEKTLGQTCKHLPLLGAALQNIEDLEDKIESYQKISDPQFRTVPKQDQTRYQATLKALRYHLIYYHSLVEMIRKNDTLLSSPQVYDFVKNKFSSNLFVKKKDPDEICRSIKGDLGELMQGELDKHQENKKKTKREIGIDL
jgi:hypothetical protein